MDDVQLVSDFDDDAIQIKKIGVNRTKLASWWRGISISTSTCVPLIRFGVLPLRLLPSALLFAPFLS